MGLIKITSDMSETERLAAYNSNMQYLEKDLPLKNLPIGIIIFFYTNINPNELYGGTWEQIKGAFIWGIDDGEQAGITGGEKTHTLTESELPKITGDLFNFAVQDSNGLGVTGHFTKFNQSMYATFGTNGATGDVSDRVTYAFGDNQPHNNMPPYYGAYVWRRTA